MRPTLITIILLAALALPGAASARGGGHDGEVRVRATCGGGARAALKVKADDRGLEVEAEVEHIRRGSAWRVTLIQEGRVAWRGRVRAAGGRFEVRRGLRDLAGADRIRLTASGPAG